MSRIVVKNLPKQLNEKELREHFSKTGNITDIRLIHKNGEFRRYAFIGFEDDGGAASACAYFNHTFIKQAKITVEKCVDPGSGQKVESWAEKKKKYKELSAQRQELAANEEGEKKKKKKKKKKEKKDQDSVKEKLLSQYEDDPSFGDFLKANKKGGKAENEAFVIAEKEDSSEEEEEEEEEEDSLAQKKNVSDQDYLKSLKKGQPGDKAVIEGTTPKKTKNKEWYTVVIRATELCKTKSDGYRCFTKRTVKAFLRPIICRSIRIPKKLRVVAYVGLKTEKDLRQALQKNRSFLDGVRVNVIPRNKSFSTSSSSSSSSSSNSSNQENNKPWSTRETALQQAEPVAESGKLFVRNLWYSVTEDLLQELFQKYGDVTDVTLPICKHTRRPKGFATVTFLFPEHAVRAMSELDGTNFKGRMLHILTAVEPPTDNKPSENPSFKEKKAQEKKATAGSWHNWNTLFLGSSAVVDIMAERYNRSKMEILDSEGKQSVAVNLALGETQIVDETRRFLEDSGVSVEAFSTPGVQRSKTTFLVKNLAAKTTSQELTEVFSKFGELGRVVLPPSGVTAIVEYLDSSEAKKGFRNLAYSKLKSLPLYLEWAPIQVFKTEFVPTREDTQGKPQGDEGLPIKGEDAAPADAQVASEPNTTIYVKNLNFSTTEEVLKQHFEKIGGISSVLIAKRRGESQGYGFVQFLRKADTQKALREMNESALEDHILQIKLSEKTLIANVKSARRIHDGGKQTSSKILVKNIPFQATTKEVKQLFVTFGEVKTLRLPLKPGGTGEHRGFGFVDFVSRQDAKKAFDTLGLSTHLYDRRLVLEWANEDETVDELRKRTADHFLGTGATKKRSKVQLDAKNKEDSDDD